jgi:AraC-like ligand binding domain
VATASRISSTRTPPNHSHHNEQIMLITAGRMDFRLQNETRTCLPGDMILIPGGVEHEVWYREDCDVIEFFSPPRLDLYPGAAPSVSQIMRRERTSAAPRGRYVVLIAGSALPTALAPRNV